MKRTRRELLRLTVAGLAAGGAFATHRAEAAAGQPTEGELAGLFDEPDAAQAIGRAFLQSQTVPHPDLASLCAEVGHALRQDVRPGGRTGLQSRFRSRIREDFVESRTVRVDGWMLSLVEAQACAITWLRVARNS